MWGQLTMAQVIFSLPLTALSTELALSLLVRTQSVVAPIPSERWLDPSLDLPSLHLCCRLGLSTLYHLSCLRDLVAVGEPKAGWGGWVHREAHWAGHLAWL